jgi:hypothetical protein
MKPTPGGFVLIACRFQRHTTWLIAQGLCTAKVRGLNAGLLHASLPPHSILLPYCACAGAEGASISGIVVCLFPPLPCQPS